MQTRGRRLDHLGREYVPAPWDSSEHLLFAVVKRAPQFNRALHQGVIRDKSVRPDGLNQFLFPDQPARVFDQIFESLIHLGTEPDLLLAFEHTSTPHVQREFAKLINY